MSNILSLQTYPLTLSKGRETFTLRDHELSDLAFVSENSVESFLYALLEPQKIALLEDRIAAARLAGLALYKWKEQGVERASQTPAREGVDDEDYSSHGPWLVRLGPRDLLSTAILSGRLGEWDQQHLLTAGAGVLLRSPLELGALANHLRRYTRLTEPDTNITLFFRLQEPGYLNALLEVSTYQVAAGFFSGVESMFYWRRSFDTVAGEIVETSLTREAVPQWPESSMAYNASHSVDGSPKMADAPVATPSLGQEERRALQKVLFERQARDLAIADATDSEERRSRYNTYLRILCAGFDNPISLSEAWRILSHLPVEAIPGFWSAVESGLYSLRFVVVGYAEDFGLQRFLEQ